ncbi:MAG TPA: SMC-Scp complex subunit ScpB [Candidatus Binataceae bacterium]
MEEERLKAILESLLFAAAEPVALSQLVTVLETVSRDDIKKALAEMAVAYGGGGRGIVLEEVAGGYQLRTPKEHALYVRKLLAAKPPRLSRPLLETVAIIAYRQPITRPEIEQLRGVDCGGVLDTLVERRLIKIAGRKEAPGRPIMYTTTPEFLELFGLKDLGGLPDLEELRLIETPREEPLFAREGDADTTDASSVVRAFDDPEFAGFEGIEEPQPVDVGEDRFASDAATAAEEVIVSDADSTSDDSAAANDAALEAAESLHPAVTVEDESAETPSTEEPVEHHSAPLPVEPEDRDPENHD